MNLLIDIGNTRMKAALFSASEMQQLEIFTSLPSLIAWANKQPVKACLISSVGLAEEELRVLQASLPFYSLLLTPELPLPIGNAYASPASLGADRLAAAVAGATKAPAQPVLVIDAGTCLTCEFVSPDGVYRGGSIAPGLRMRFRAMHAFTQKLPLLELSVDSAVPALVGDSTQAAMESGVVNGMLAELEGLIDRYRTDWPGLQVFLGGGDAKIFETKINRRIFAIPEIVLVGLNEILQYNVSDK
jgi:type III pantothenate kinase